MYRNENILFTSLNYVLNQLIRLLIIGPMNLMSIYI